jgi:hypothetical protein
LRETSLAASLIAFESSNQSFDGFPPLIKAFESATADRIGYH